MKEYWSVITSNVKKYIIVAFLAVILVGFYLVIAPQSQPDRLPRFVTEGNKIIRNDTGQPVILRGVVSDYFRYRSGDPRDLKLEDDFTVLKKAKNSGGINLVGLYLADIKKIKQNIDELDAYLSFTEKNGMYVYLMPVAREFDGKTGPNDWSRIGTFEDLKELLSILSSRYNDYNHVMYGLGAEPDTEDHSLWRNKQLALSDIVRKNDPDSILLVTDVDYKTLAPNYLENPFPYENVVYYGGGYAASNFEGEQKKPKQARSVIERVVANPISKNYPYISGEFGGYWENEFSSKGDLRIIRKMLEGLNKNDIHYTMYRLNSIFLTYESSLKNENAKDMLSLYDKRGNITKRGKVFIEALRNSPPTQFNS